MPKDVACLMTRSQFLPLAEYRMNSPPAARTNNSTKRSPSICSRCSRLARHRITSSREECGQHRHSWRTEEHTSELQSLMRNSYTIFCLKKKKTTKKSHQ